MNLSQRAIGAREELAQAIRAVMTQRTESGSRKLTQAQVSRASKADVRLPKVSTSAISAWCKGERLPGSYAALDAFLTAVEKATPLPRGRLDRERKALGRLLEAARKETLPEPTPSVVTFRVRDADPLELMVHRARTAEDGNAVPTYIARDVDGRVRQALTRAGHDGGVVLLVGDSTAGKTRCAFEAMSEVLPDRLLFVPRDFAQLPETIDAIAHAASDGERCLLWLDDAERYLSGPAGLNLAGLRRLRAAKAVVLGTMRTRIRRDLPPHELTRLAEEFEVSRLWSPPEIERARRQLRADRDPRLRQALRQADDFGIAESFAAGPQLWRMLCEASVVGGNPRGAALVRTAIDLALAGWEAPVTVEFLQHLHEDYLPGVNKQLIGPEPLRDALEWATSPREGVTRLLIPEAEGFRSFDYLVDAHLREKRPSPELIPQKIWDVVLEHGDDHQRFSIAVAAHANDRVDIALRSLGPLAESGDVEALRALGLICERRDREEAAQWLQLAVDAGDALAMRLMGNLRWRMSDGTAAHQWYRRAAEAGDEVSQAYGAEQVTVSTSKAQEVAQTTPVVAEPVEQDGEEWEDWEDEPWEPSPRTLRVLEAAFEILADDAYNTVEEVGDARVNLRDDYASVFSELPVLTWGQNAQWRRQMARCFDDLAADIRAGKWPLPKCTGEEMAMHLATAYASDMAADDPETIADWVAELPETPDDYDFGMCKDIFLEDYDVLFLYEPWAQGIENPDRTDNQILGIANLGADDWFEPFRENEVRDPERGFRR